MAAENRAEMAAMASRYSRQMLLSEIGANGQRSLAKSRVLIIGCGGLGCPSGLYLAAAGIGHLGLVDGDSVAIDNLHRQIAYRESDIDAKKAESLKSTLKQLNTSDSLKITTYCEFLTPQNAVALAKEYDLVLDCTDNVATRYLINDACILAKKPLVSASALRWEGQLTVYGHEGGPCYRCLFPEPPPAAAVGSCSANGVVGPVVGTMGCLQALEAIKLLTGQQETLSGRLLIFDGLTMQFRTVKLRPSRDDCRACGKIPLLRSLTDLNEATSIYLNAQPTACVVPLKLLEPNQRLSCQQFSELKSTSDVVLVDVRPSNHFDVCHIDGAKNIPLTELAKRCKQELGSANHIVAVCRRGNDSQRAIKVLQEHFGDAKILHDIVGGCTAWKEQIDSSFILL